MSIADVDWALRQVKDIDPTSKLILIGLANHASGENGEGAWPSRTTLAEYAGTSVKTVQRRLELLQEAGLIKRGDQHLVSHYRPDRRPVVYDLVKGHGGSICPPVDGGTRGDTGGQNGGTRGDTVVPQTVILESIPPTPSRRRHCRTHAEPVDNCARCDRDLADDLRAAERREPTCPTCFRIRRLCEKAGQTAGLECPAW